MQMIEKEPVIAVDRQAVLTRIGYCDDYEPSARIESLVNGYIENYHDLIESSYSYTIKDIGSVRGDTVSIGDSVVLRSGVVARLLERCQQVVIFALTIGSHLEELVAHLAENGLVLQATVLDAVGSGAAEQLAVFVEERIRDIASSNGLVISRRFSPGYCDWDVDQQKMIFKVMKDNASGVRLTKGNLMLPRKSVSGIVGIGTRDSGVDDYNPCRTCLKQDCLGRRA